LGKTVYYNVTAYANDFNPCKFAYRCRLIDSKTNMMSNIDSAGDCKNVRTCYTTKGQAVNTTDKYCGLNLVVTSGSVQKQAQLLNINSVAAKQAELPMVAAIKQKAQDAEDHKSTM
jgi:hypothetical protein